MARESIKAVSRSMAFTMRMSRESVIDTTAQRKLRENNGVSGAGIQRGWLVKVRTRRSPRPVQAEVQTSVSQIFQTKKGEGKGEVCAFTLLKMVNTKLMDLIVKSACFLDVMGQSLPGEL